MKPPRNRDAADQDTAGNTRQRLDKWLWHARMARTRTLAAGLITAGHVRVNSRRVSSSSQPVRVDDVLTLALAHATLVVKVLAFAERRGPAVEARQLYTLLSGPADAQDDGGDDATDDDGSPVKNA